MQRTILLAPSAWPHITSEVMGHVNDAQFSQSGMWRLSHVQLNIPLEMANTNRDGHLQLFHGLEKQGLGKRICAARRTDVALVLTFERG